MCFFVIHCRGLGAAVSVLLPAYPVVEFQSKKSRFKLIDYIKDDCAIIKKIRNTNISNYILKFNGPRRNYCKCKLI